MVLQDDLGAFDNCFNGNTAACDRTANISNMAKDGVSFDFWNDVGA
jgi:hypothetical protein